MCSIAERDGGAHDSLASGQPGRVFAARASMISWYCFALSRDCQSIHFMAPCGRNHWCTRLSSLMLGVVSESRCFEVYALRNFSIMRCTASLSGPLLCTQTQTSAPRLLRAVMASASCARVSKHAMYLCGGSVSWGHTERTSDACRCSANHAQCEDATIHPPTPMTSPSALASAAAKQCSSGFWSRVRLRSCAKHANNHCSASLLSFLKCSSARCGLLCVPRCPSARESPWAGRLCR